MNDILHKKEKRAWQKNTMRALVWGSSGTAHFRPFEPLGRLGQNKGRSFIWVYITKRMPCLHKIALVKQILQPCPIGHGWRI